MAKKASTPSKLRRMIRSVPETVKALMVVERQDGDRYMKMKWNPR